jgi:hypothetical protein
MITEAELKSATKELREILEDALRLLNPERNPKS